MSFTKLNKLVTDAAQAISLEEKFSIPSLLKKASAYREKFPYDQTLMIVGKILEFRDARGDIFISRGELKDLYNKSHRSDTKFNEMFAEELGTQKIQKQASEKDSNYQVMHESADTLKTEDIADPVLLNALSNIFDKNGPKKVYSAKTSEEAKNACSRELNSIGYSPAKISVFAGNESFIVCDAEFKTPKGTSHVLVPVEVNKKSQVLLPTMFLSKQGFVDLEKGLLKIHLLKNAGKSHYIDGEALLSALGAAKFGVDEPLNLVKKAALEINARKETPSEYTPDGILYQEIDPEKVEVEFDKYAVDDETKSFVEKLSSVRGSAEHLYGRQLVRNAQDSVVRKIASMGYRAQTGVVDVGENTIVFGVSISDTAGFKLPVKVANNKPNIPNYIIASGEIYPFNQNTLNMIVAHNRVDPRAMSAASTLREMTPEALMGVIKEATAVKDYLKAEDALNVMKQEHGEELFHRAYNYYVNNITKTASVEEEKPANPEHLEKLATYCRVTGLSPDKVYQDKDGHCYPSWRKDLIENKEWGTFMTNKVFI